MTSSLSLVLEHAFFALTTEIKLFHYADSSIRMLYTVQYMLQSLYAISLVVSCSVIGNNNYLNNTNSKLKKKNERARPVGFHNT